MKEYMEKTFVLGAPDPEMEKIEVILREHNQKIVHAQVDGQRVHSRNAYVADPVDDPIVVTVECDMPRYDGHVTQRVDHHRKGDPGYGMPPKRYWAASSLGQICKMLKVDSTPELRIIAAADHCLNAAYRGICPCIVPDDVMQWRVASRAKFQNKNPEVLLKEVEETRASLRQAKEISLSQTITVCDMRREPPFPELPEAAAREGIGYLSGPLKGPGGNKFTCSGTPEQVRAFINEWGPQNGLTGIYGDPTRGFAGGYEKKNKN